MARLKRVYVLAALTAGTMLVSGLHGVGAEPLRIVHEPPPCLPSSGFLAIEARIEPSDAATGVSLFLRSQDGSPFYRMAMTPRGSRFLASLPVPSPETKQIQYFLEPEGAPGSQTETFRVSRPEQVPADCSAAVATELPGALSPTVNGAPAFPAGFLAPDAVVESLAVQGSSPEEKRSRKKGVLLALGAAGGAAVGLGLLTGGSSETEEPGVPNPPEPPIPPPVQPPEPPPVGPVTACFDAPEMGVVGVPVRMDASCSSPRDSLAYEWKLGDGRVRDGRVINPAYAAAGLYTVELHVSRAATTGGVADEDRTERTIQIVDASTAPAPGPSANLAIVKQGQLTSKIVDGVLHFHIDYTVTVTNLGPDSAQGAVVSDSLVSDLTPTSLTASQGSCTAVVRDVTCSLGAIPQGAQATARIGVDVRPGVLEGTILSNTASVDSGTRDPDPSNNRDTEMTQLLRASTSAPRSATGVEFGFVSTLVTEGRTGPVSASVRVDESHVDVVNEKTSFPHRGRARGERTEIEAVVTEGASGSFRFDFSRDAHVEPGSLEVLEGQLLGKEPLAITFRLSGRPGERLRFAFRVRR